jgi:hypothetical protein
VAQAVLHTVAQDALGDRAAVVADYVQEMAAEFPVKVFREFPEVVRAVVTIHQQEAVVVLDQQLVSVIATK